MFCDVSLKEPPRANFHGQEHVQHPEGHCDRYKEVTCNNRHRLVPNKSGPTLVGASSARTDSVHVLADSPWWDPDTEPEF